MAAVAKAVGSVSAAARQRLDRARRRLAEPLPFDAASATTELAALLDMPAAHV
jgi:hypothetical protein